MRPDMSQVLIERPRWAHAARYPRAYVRNKTDDGERGRNPLPTETWGPPRERMGGFYGDKEFSDHLGPLRRFLQSRVGRPWSKVKSEMAEQLRVTSTVQRHVMEHVRDYVWERTWFDDDGVMWGVDRYGRPDRVVSWSRPRFFVHPRSGLLERMPTSRPRKTNAPPDPNVRTIVADRFQHRRVNGIWFEVELAPLPESAHRSWRLGPPVWDVAARREVRRRMSTFGDPEPMAVEWRRGFYARAMRQLSKRELRAVRAAR